MSVIKAIQHDYSSLKAKFSRILSGFDSFVIK